MLEPCRLLQSNQARFGGRCNISPGRHRDHHRLALQTASFRSNFAANDGAPSTTRHRPPDTSGVQLVSKPRPTATAAIGNGGGIYSAGPLSLHDTFFLFKTRPARAAR